MKALTITLALLLPAGVLLAQDQNASPNGQEITRCLEKADAAAWTSMGLTPEQTRRAEELRAQWTAARTVPNATAEQLKAIMAPEQFARFVAWCKGK